MSNKQEEKLKPEELRMMLGNELIPGELKPKRSLMFWNVTYSRPNKRETVLSINGLNSKGSGVPLNAILNNCFGL